MRADELDAVDLAVDVRAPLEAGVEPLLGPAPASIRRIRHCVFSQKSPTTKPSAIPLAADVGVRGPRAVDRDSRRRGRHPKRVLPPPGLFRPRSIDSGQPIPAKNADEIAVEAKRVATAGLARVHIPVGHPDRARLGNGAARSAHSTTCGDRRCPFPERPSTHVSLHAGVHDVERMVGRREVRRSRRRR